MACRALLTESYTNCCFFCNRHEAHRRKNLGSARESCSALPRFILSSEKNEDTDLHLLSPTWAPARASLRNVWERCSAQHAQSMCPAARLSWVSL